MKNIKVLGIGSPFGDDQAGWKVIDRLQQLLVIPKHSNTHVSMEVHDRPGVRLIELLDKANAVFLIDAIKSNNILGTIHQFEKKDIIDSSTLFSTHNFGVLQALQLANALNTLPDPLIFYGIEIKTIRLDTSMSLCVQEAAEQLAHQLKNTIELLI